MSEKLPTREQALQILREYNCSEEIIAHCEAVSKLAVKTARALKGKGFNVDIALVEVGALLHDLGRSATHTVHHALIGADLAKKARLPEAVISIIKRHVGGGITADEAESLGWPKDIYMPVTLEEKIVAYADKLIEKADVAPIEVTVEKLRKENKHEAAERVRKLYMEITSLMGDGSCPC
ncbi:MAG: HDIG domain-containing protein [Candidatus Bathyarchaeota archaeon]|nr:HDIG domain-containing protein [Candidatus Bathyarchaeota archaeon]